MDDRFDVRALYDALNAKRQVVGLDWRDLAKEAHVNASTFSRMGVQGLAPNVENLARMLIWLEDTDIKHYIRDEGQQAPARLWRVEPLAGGDFMVVHPAQSPIGPLRRREVAEAVRRAMETNESEVSP